MLNEEQKKAISILTKPLLVVAGAGTGKTNLITNKIKFLNQQLDIDPERILAITFTNKAAKEMKTRIEDGAIKFPYILTFHSFALKILKSHFEEAGLNKNFTIYDEKDQISVVKNVLKEINIEIKKEPKRILNEISLFKEGKIKTLPEDTSKVFKKYQETLYMSNAIDFDDIIILANQVLQENPEINQLWKDAFDYILVDEFQDTNKPQIELLKKIYNEKAGNLTVVGDPNQCIYSWRGSEISNILKFEIHFPGCEIIKLQQNYRSTQKIVEVANKIVEGKIPEKFLPMLVSNKYEGKYPTIKIFKSDTEEAKRIAATVQYLKENRGYSYRDFAVLVRNSNITDEIEKEFIKQKIPYDVHGKYNFTEKSEIKLILSYIKLALNPEDEIAFKYCINTPSRNIGEKTVEFIKENYKENWIETIKNNMDKFKEKQRKQIDQFLKIIEQIKIDIENKNKKIIDNVIKLIDIKNYLEKKYKDKKTVTKKINNINLLKQLIEEKQFEIQEFIETITLSSGQDDISKEDTVKIITIHSAKGLQFPVVFIPALEKGIFPSSEEEIDEERRVLYTAITRAEDLVFISAAKYRKGFDKVIKPSSISPFIKEVLKTIPKKSKV